MKIFLPSSKSRSYLSISMPKEAALAVLRGLSIPVLVLQTQLACKPDRLRLNSVFFAITRSGRAQADVALLLAGGSVNLEAVQPNIALCLSR